MTRENPSLGNWCVVCQSICDPTGNIARGVDGGTLPCCLSCWSLLSPESRLELSIKYQLAKHVDDAIEENEDEDDDDEFGLFGNTEWGK